MMVRLWIVPTVAKRVGFPRLNPLNGRIALVTIESTRLGPQRSPWPGASLLPHTSHRVFEYRGRL